MSTRCSSTLGAGRDAAGEHVLAEGRGEHPGRARFGDERATAGPASGESVRDDPVDLLPHGHPGHAEALREDALRRQHRTDGEAAGEVLQDLANLVTLGPVGPELAWGVPLGRRGCSLGGP